MATDRRPHRVPGMDGAGAIGRPHRSGLGKAGGDSPHPRRQQPVGAPEHSVLLVDQGRQPERRRGQHGRHRWVAAKTDDRLRCQPAQQPARLNRACRQFRQATRGLNRTAAEPSGTHPMNRDSGNAQGESIRPRIGQ